LISRATAEELVQVLAYPKFRLSPSDGHELLAEFLPFCEEVNPHRRCAAICRDKRDQPFLDLAQSGRAEVLVSGDSDLLALAAQTSFAIETAEAYRARVFGK
jgi:putative PIN family toxin of toxin-antitoxin system